MRPPSSLLASLLLLSLLPPPTLSFSPPPTPFPCAPVLLQASRAVDSFSVDGQSGYAIPFWKRTSHTASGADSPASLAADVTTTLEGRRGPDRTLPKFSVKRRVKILDYQHLWTGEDWEKHISRSR